MPYACCLFFWYRKARGNWSPGLSHISNWKLEAAQPRKKSMSVSIYSPCFNKIWSEIETRIRKCSGTKDGQDSVELYNINIRIISYHTISYHIISYHVTLLFCSFHFQLFFHQGSIIRLWEFAQGSKRGGLWHSGHCRAGGGRHSDGGICGCTRPSAWEFQLKSLVSVAHLCSDWVAASGSDHLTSESSYAGLEYIPRSHQIPRRSL